MKLKLNLGWNETVISSLIAVGCMVGIISLQIPQLAKLTRQSKIINPETVKKEVEAEKLRLDLVKKMPIFGYDNLFADWVFLQFVQYFGDDEARSVGDYQLSPEYFEIIIDRDPRFLQSYLFLSTSISLYAGQPEQSVLLMEKGLKSLHPQVPEKSYYVWRYKAIDELLFLSDSKAARDSFLKTTEWASFYNDDESKFVALSTKETAEFLENNAQSKRARISSWGMILGNSADKKTRERAIDEIEKLGGKVIEKPNGEFGLEVPKED